MKSMCHALKTAMLFFFLTASLSIPFEALAEAETLTLTVYNQDLALINEIREMTTPKGLQTIVFQDVAETIDPASLQVRSLTAPNDFKILDQNYEYDLINVQNLLNKYIGKELQVVVPDPKGPQGARIIRQARLLANNDRPIFMLDGQEEGSSAKVQGQVYVGNYEAVLLPQIPEGLRPQPTLLWLTDNRGAEQQRIEVSYLATNINWKADYVLKVNRENSSGALSGWVTLDNQCGKTFKGARLKLVAGDVHRVREDQRLIAMEKVRVFAGAAVDEGMQQEELFEYHLYSLARNVDIANRQTKQISLLQSPEVKLGKRLVGRWNGEYYEGGRQGVIKQKIEVFLKFKNDAANGLGIPLPKGTVRAYQESEDGTVIFIGEDRIDHTAKEAEVELKMGDAFDVSVERKQTEFRRTGANSVRFAWELTLKNGKDAPQQVELEETLPGEWRIQRSSTEYEKLDAHRIRFTVDAQPSASGRESVIAYEVESTH